jgi:hypothetical protein
VRPQITYPDGATYAGAFNDARLKHGEGRYAWARPPAEEEEEHDAENSVPHAEYQGAYADGVKCGVGRMTYPNGDVYIGEWRGGLHDGEGVCACLSRLHVLSSRLPTVRIVVDCGWAALARLAETHTVTCAWLQPACTCAHRRCACGDNSHFTSHSTADTPTARSLAPAPPRTHVPPQLQVPPPPPPKQQIRASLTRALAAAALTAAGARAGTYTYKGSGDIYSGSWAAGKKVGQGTYQFGADMSMMQGAWVDGSITEGKWVSCQR